MCVRVYVRVCACVCVRVHAHVFAWVCVLVLASARLTVSVRSSLVFVSVGPTESFPPLPHPRYHRLLLCAPGVGALWKGWLPTWLRMAPWSLVFFVTFEQLRRITGQSSF
jgi:hypothetical protein